MRWPRRLAKPVELRPMVSTRAMELQTAKEILAEVFHARCGTYMVQMDYFRTAQI